MGPPRVSRGRCGQGPEVIGARLFHFLGIKSESAATLPRLGLGGEASCPGVWVPFLKGNIKEA